jgi:hypothetical protein
MTKCDNPAYTVDKVLEIYGPNGDVGKREMKSKWVQTRGKQFLELNYDEGREMFYLFAFMGFPFDRQQLIRFRNQIDDALKETNASSG